MSAPPTSTPAGRRTPPTDLPPAPPGSRLETAWLLVQLAGDLLSVPFHLVLFLATRGAHRRRFLAALGRAGGPADALDRRP